MTTTRPLPRRYSRLAVAAGQLLEDGFAALIAEGVIPRSRHEPWIHVGQHYDGSTIHRLPARSHFSGALVAAFPDRFRREGGGFQWDHAELYADPLISAAVARLTIEGHPYDHRDPISQELVTELVEYLRSGREPTTVARLVEDLTVEKGFSVSGLSITPKDEFDRGAFESAIERLMPGMAHEIHRFGRPISIRPTSMVVVESRPHFEEATRINGAFSIASRIAERRIDRFLTGLRLATAATVRSLMQVEGQPGWVKPYQTGEITAFPQVGITGLNRLASIDSQGARRVERLMAIVDIATRSTDAAVPALALGIQRFNRSFEPGSWTEQIVDLMISLEAAMGEPGEKHDVTLRIRSRTAALIATQSDPVSQVFVELGRFYDLRSTIVHGQALSWKAINRALRAIPITAAAPQKGYLGDLAVDRLRDIVRRALLARLFLGAGSSPEWPLGETSDLDQRLIDPPAQRSLRAAWRSGLSRLGLAAAAQEGPEGELIGHPVGRWITERAGRRP